ncbi:hypothetical protein ACEWY4_011414 [Coilia grayii]|uniref:HYDIN/VesB/CFA65-like Ig-like domain-containing protein n=1 Tax=Coilia grayii TaxID=363190 RepID=A0ABD1K4P7_9TELE
MSTQIITQEGDVWPNSTAEVNIVFKPQEAKLYQQTVYCDITGRESRLPLRIKGEGIGPKLQFNFDLLDMGNIFIGSKHSYEVLLSNKGLIAASYQLLEPSSAQGRCFSVSPRAGRIPPGECHTLEVTFTSSTLGVFSEDFHFAIEGNPLTLILTFRGCVMGPTFHFSVPKLDFGEVSFGFPHTLACCLTNTSLVPMTFRLRVPGDGTGPPSVTSALQVSQLDRTDWHGGVSLGEWPSEFSIVPSSGTVRAQGQVDLQQSGTAVWLRHGPLVALRAERHSGVAQARPTGGTDSGAAQRRGSGAAHCQVLMRGSADTTRTSQNMDEPGLVTLCSNTVRSYSLALVVDVEGVGEDVLALPIHARCCVPSVVLEKPVLRLEKCFVDYAYETLVTLTNTSDLPVCYGLLSQGYEEHPSLLYSSPHPRGVIQPHTSAELPVVVQAKALGPLEVTAHIAVLGSQRPPLALLLSCLAAGPVIHVPFAEVDFGSIPVLTDVRRPLQLSNRSPISARFRAQMCFPGLSHVGRPPLIPQAALMLSSRSIRTAFAGYPRRQNRSWDRKSDTRNNLTERSDSGSRGEHKRSRDSLSVGHVSPSLPLSSHSCRRTRADNCHRRHRRSCHRLVMRFIFKLPSRGNSLTLSSPLLRETGIKAEKVICISQVTPEVSMRIRFYSPNFPSSEWGHVLLES